MRDRISSVPSNKELIMINFSLPENYDEPEDSSQYHTRIKKCNTSSMKHHITWVSKPTRDKRNKILTIWSFGNKLNLNLRASNLGLHCHIIFWLNGLKISRVKNYRIQFRLYGNLLTRLAYIDRLRDNRMYVNYLPGKIIQMV